MWIVHQNETQTHYDAMNPFYKDLFTMYDGSIYVHTFMPEEGIRCL